MADAEDAVFEGISAPVVARGGASESSRSSCAFVRRTPASSGRRVPSPDSAYERPFSPARATLDRVALPRRRATSGGPITSSPQGYARGGSHAAGQSVDIPSKNNASYSYDHVCASIRPRLRSSSRWACR